MSRARLDGPDCVRGARVFPPLLARLVGRTPLTARGWPLGLGIVLGFTTGFAAAQLRAVENRRYLVRAAGSGISAIIDPWGRVQTQSAPMSEALIVGTFAPRNDVTVYHRLGNWPWWITAVVTAWMSLCIGTRVAKGNPRTEDEDDK